MRLVAILLAALVGCGRATTLSPTISQDDAALDDGVARSTSPTPMPVAPTQSPVVAPTQSPVVSFAPSSVPDGSFPSPTIAPTARDAKGGGLLEGVGAGARDFVNARSTLELCGAGAIVVLLLCCLCGRLCKACRDCCRGDEAEAHERGRETIAANRARHASKGGNSSRLGVSQMFDDEASQQIELGENPMRKKQQQQQQQKQRGGDRKGGGAKTREPAPARGRRDDDDEEDPAPRLSSHSRARGGSGAKKKKERREAPEPPLPEEWEEFETDEGEKYYQNHETGETQWERP